MTISQKSQKPSFKPISIALASIFLTTFSFNASTATSVTVSNPIQPVTITMDANAALSQPNMSDSAILNWATDAARSAYSYDFKNYSKQMQNNQQNFTPSGWTAFMVALNKSNNLQVVQNKKLVASAVVVGKPSIVKKGVKNGVYFWNIQIPLLATYESESRLIKQNLQVNMLVVRGKTANGIGISHFVAAVVPASQQPVTSGIVNSIPDASTNTPMGSTSTTISPPTTGTTTGGTMPSSPTTTPSTGGAAMPPTTGTTGTDMSGTGGIPSQPPNTSGSFVTPNQSSPGTSTNQ